MPFGELHRVRIVQQLERAAEYLDQSSSPAVLAGTAISPNGDISALPNLDLLKEEAEARGLHVLVLREEDKGFIRLSALISREPELTEEILKRCGTGPEHQKRP
jgi:hypothetical protein